jgi:hypothetical protein
VAALLAVRVVLWATGNHFSTNRIGPYEMWHLPPPEAMRANPFGALWDQHSQPPLFAVFVGLVLGWSPLPDALSLQMLFTAAACLAALALFDILRLCGVRRWVAALAAVVVFCDPILVGYELVLYHEPVVVPLVTFVIWTVARYATRPRLGWLGLMLATATVLVLTRAVFVPLWLVALLVVVLAVRRPQACGPGDGAGRGPGRGRHDRGLPHAGQRAAGRVRERPLPGAARPAALRPRDRGRAGGGRPLVVRPPGARGAGGRDCRA